MADEQLARIEAQLALLVTGQDELKGEVRDLRASQDDLRAGHNELRAGQDQLRTGQDDLRTSVGELRVGQDELRGGQLLILKRLDKLEIGQEGLTDNVKALAEGQAALGITMRRGFDDLREEIGRRLDPLEAAVRGLRN